MVTVTYVHLVGERWLIKTSSGKIARAANREKWLAETQR
jgi:fatty-acyl-CoA synthase